MNGVLEEREAIIDRLVGLGFVFFFIGTKNSDSRGLVEFNVLYFLKSLTQKEISKASFNISFIKTNHYVFQRDVYFVNM